MTLKLSNTFNKIFELTCIRKKHKLLSSLFKALSSQPLPILPHSPPGTALLNTMLHSSQTMCSFSAWNVPPGLFTKSALLTHQLQTSQFLTYSFE